MIKSSPTYSQILYHLFYAVFCVNNAIHTHIWLSYCTVFVISLGHVNALATIENIIEHVATYLKKDKLEIRMLNMVPANVPRLLCPPVESNVIKDEVLPLLKDKAAYHERMIEVEQYNKVSRYVLHLRRRPDLSK